MCGRFTREFVWGEICDVFDIRWSEIGEIAPSWNIAPTQVSPIVRLAPEGKGGVDGADTHCGERELVWMRWGLVPFWAKDEAIGARLINARAETVGEKPAFREAYRRRRCVVPVSGFYEWKKVGHGGLDAPHAPERMTHVGLFGELEDAPAKHVRSKARAKPAKQPYYIVPTAGKVLALAGLWESWWGEDAHAKPLETFTILTTTPNAMMAGLHDRMPVVLDGAGVVAWLEKETDAGELGALLRPAPEGTLDCWAVGTAVNRAGHDERGLIERVDGDC